QGGVCRRTSGSRSRVPGLRPNLLGGPNEARGLGGPSLRSAPMTHERTSQLAASPPMFESRFLDFFSRVHPIVPALIFVPVVVGGIWLGIDRGLAVWTVALLFLA